MKMEVSLNPIGFNDRRSIDVESNASTEDTLISSRSTIDSRCKDTCYDICSKKKKLRPIIYLLGSVLFVFLGIASIVWTPFEILMNERLKMRPSFPPFQWWKYPPDEVMLKVYIFNVTNTEEFMSGVDKKLKLAEVGPIVFLEKLTHTDTIFNENGTLSYTSTRKAIYLPELNNIDIHQELNVVNIAVLGMAAFMADKSYFLKLGLKLMNNNVGNRPFSKISIYNYLWNYTDPLVDKAKQVTPFMVPITNLGVLNKIYLDFSDRITVTIGPQYGDERFFAMDKFQGKESLPYLPSTCNDKIVNATEGVLYPQRITKNISLNYYRKTMCRVTPLVYEMEKEKYGITGYNFVLPENTYDRTSPKEEDCYKGKPSLPNGLSDVSSCQYGVPMASSFPHFLHGDPSIDDFVEGLTPSNQNHSSFALVEPLTGIPMEGKARSQSNLVIGDLSFFGPILNKFSKTVVPMFWAEYHQVGLPFYVLALLYFQVKVLPVLQWFFTAFYFMLGFYCMFKFMFNQRREGMLLIRNAQRAFEREHFLKNKPFSRISKH